LNVIRRGKRYASASARSLPQESSVMQVPLKGELWVVVSRA